MKHFDFIEIGTAYFGTLIEKADDNSVGISVEPIREYLDRLPGKPGVIKVHAAITDVKAGDTIKVFYVTQETITKHSLGDWLAGCNSVNKPHDFHTAYTDDPGYCLSRPELVLAGRNLVNEGLVQCVEVPVMTFGELGRLYEIGQVDLVKIDTEGHDPYVVASVIGYYDHVGWELLPKQIQFEKNRHSDPRLVAEMVENLRDHHYDVVLDFNDGVATLPK